MIIFSLYKSTATTVRYTPPLQPTPETALGHKHGNLPRTSYCTIRYLTPVNPFTIRKRKAVLRTTPRPQREAIMTEKADVFKCRECGCIVTVLKGGKGSLDCCGKPMIVVTPDEAKKLSFDLSRPGAP